MNSADFSIAAHVGIAKGAIESVISGNATTGLSDVDVIFIDEVLNRVLEILESKESPEVKRLVYGLTRGKHDKKAVGY